VLLFVEFQIHPAYRTLLLRRSLQERHAKAGLGRKRFNRLLHDQMYVKNDCFLAEWIPLIDRKSVGQVPLNYCATYSLQKI